MKGRIADLFRISILLSLSAGKITLKCASWHVKTTQKLGYLNNIGCALVMKIKTAFALFLHYAWLTLYL